MFKKIAVVVALYFLLRNKEYTATDFETIVPDLVKEFGIDITYFVESIYRLETRNFDSLQYKKTGTPGMEAHGLPPTYGWYKPFFDRYPEFLPIGVYPMRENNTGIIKPFLIMPSVRAGAFFLGDYIRRWNNPLRWFSTNPEAQQRYLASLRNVTPTFTLNYQNRVTVS
jgi:hypothetical protein